LETANFMRNNSEIPRNDDEYEEYYVEEEFKEENQAMGEGAPLRETEIDKSRTSRSSILDAHLVHFNKFLE